MWFVEGERATTRFGCIIPVSAKEVVWQASAPASALKAARLKLELQASPSPSAQGDVSFHRDPKTVRCLMWWWLTSVWMPEVAPRAITAITTAVSQGLWGFLSAV